MMCIYGMCHGVQPVHVPAIVKSSSIIDLIDQWEGWKPS